MSPNVITCPPQWEAEGYLTTDEGREVDDGSRDWSDVLQRWRKRSRAEEFRQPLEAEKPKESNFSPRVSSKPCRHPVFSPVKPVSDLRPPQLSENKFVLFYATKFAVIC